MKKGDAMMKGMLAVCFMLLNVVSSYAECKDLSIGDWCMQNDTIRTIENPNSPQIYYIHTDVSQRFPGDCTDLQSRANPGGCKKSFSVLCRGGPHYELFLALCRNTCAFSQPIPIHIVVDAGAAATVFDLTGHVWIKDYPFVVAPLTVEQIRIVSKMSRSVLAASPYDSVTIDARPAGTDRIFSTFFSACEHL
jgi:hypothetical protein